MLSDASRRIRIRNAIGLTDQGVNLDVNIKLELQMKDKKNELELVPYQMTIFPYEHLALLS